MFETFFDTMETEKKNTRNKILNPAQCDIFSIIIFVLMYFYQQ
jgi:hypothetical protein